MAIADRAPWLTINTAGEELLAELERVIRRPSWHADAACAEHPQAWWFPDKAGGKQDTARARAVCALCLVATECRTWALDQGQELRGVWAGLSEGDRLEIRMGRRAA